MHLASRYTHQSPNVCPTPLHSFLPHKIYNQGDLACVQPSIIFRGSREAQAGALVAPRDPMSEALRRRDAAVSLVPGELRRRCVLASDSWCWGGLPLLYLAQGWGRLWSSRFSWRRARGSHLTRLVVVVATEDAVLPSFIIEATSHAVQLGLEDSRTSAHEVLLIPRKASVGSSQDIIITGYIQNPPLSLQPPDLSRKFHKRHVMPRHPERGV